MKTLYNYILRKNYPPLYIYVFNFITGFTPPHAHLYDPDPERKILESYILYTKYYMYNINVNSDIILLTIYIYMNYILFIEYYYYCYSSDISFRESRHTLIYMRSQSIKYMKLTYVNKNKGKIHVKRTIYEKPYKNLVTLRITR